MLVACYGADSHGLSGGPGEIYRRTINKEYYMSELGKCPNCASMVTDKELVGGLARLGCTCCATEIEREDAALIAEDKGRPEWMRVLGPKVQDLIHAKENQTGGQKKGHKKSIEIERCNPKNKGGASMENVDKPEERVRAKCLLEKEKIEMNEEEKAIIGRLEIYIRQTKQRNKENRASRREEGR